MSENSVKPLPFFFVGKEETQKRVNAFINSKHKLLSEAIGKTETKSVWYSRGHIEGLLEEMNMANADGLRIYFGCYPADNELVGSQLCLLMVITKQDNETGAHADITIEDSPDFETRQQVEKSFSETTERDFNVGSPCPPICGGHIMKYT